MELKEQSRVAYALGQIPRFGEVSPSPEAIDELCWFFNEAADEVEPPTPLAMHLSGASRVSMEDVERRAEAIHAAGTIKRRLDTLRVSDVRMLEALFTECAWPKSVKDALGLLAGPVEALALVRAEHLAAVVRLETSAESVEEWLDERIAAGGPGAVAFWRAEAELACAIAVHGYEQARGTRGSVVPDSAWAEEDGD